MKTIHASLQVMQNHCPMCMLKVTPDTNFDIAFDNRKLAREAWDKKLEEWTATLPAQGAEFTKSSHYKEYFETHPRFAGNIWRFVMCVCVKTSTSSTGTYICTNEYV
jgi:hypothetical protein